MRNKVGHYDVVEELGRGGMGVVYKGFESALSRHVAIKLMSESLAHDQQVVERFLREARSMAQLNDPHIIQIYMIGEDAGQPFFAMEFVEGESLSQTLRREGRIEPKRALDIIAQAAQGLSVAHDRGVVHRDIKPANLMITPRGLVKVADFGIALSHDFDKKLTGTGEFVGTPGYLSPEVCLGKTVDQRSDIFALGIVLFEMLAGRMPFTDQSPLGLMLEVVRAEIPDVRTLGANVSPAVVEILNKMLAKDPDQRFGSCHDMLAHIQDSGVLHGAQSVSMQAAGITSAATLPQGARAPQPQTAPRAPLPNIGAAPPIPAATVVSGMNRPLATPPQMPPVAPSYSQPAQLAPHGYVPQPAKPAGKVMPWAIAATLLVGAGAGAFATKDRWMRQPVATPTALAEPATTVSADTSSPSVASQAVDKVEPVATPAVAVETTTTADTGVPDSTAAKLEEMAQAQALQQKQLEESQRQLAELQAQQGAATPTRVNVEQQQQRQPLAGVRERVDTISKEELTPKYATTQQTPSVAAVPKLRQGIAVVALGDRGPAGAAELAIESALSDAGYTIIDEETAMSNVGGSAQTALAAAKRAGISGLIVVRVTRTGTQQLTFYGQSDTRFLARMEVKAFNVQNGAAVGSWGQEIGYTGLNAGEEGRSGVAPYLAKMVSKMAAHRGRG